MARDVETSYDEFAGGNDPLVGEFFHMSLELCVLMNTAGTFVEVNPAWEVTLGYSPQALVGRSIFELLHADDAERFYTALTEVRGGRSVTALRLRVMAVDGGHRWLEMTARPVLDVERIVVVLRDVTTSRAAEEQLRIARDEAERASRYKSEFLSRTSHELRTPLNAVIGFSQLLEMEELTAAQSGYVASILTSGRHLLALIDEILEISRIESGQLRISVEAVKVFDRIDEAIDLVRPQAADRDIRLSRIGGNGDLTVMADNQRLLQVLLNLLSNALKYSDPGDSVEISADASGGTVTIAVCDTGPGISESDKAKIFVPFERLGREQTDIPGTGIGLPLSQALTHEMGGALTVHSQLGVGSTFCVELREAPEDLSGGFDPAVKAPDASRSDGSGSTDGLTVLQIEDNLANRKVMEAALANLPDVRLVSAAQGSIGIEMAASIRPDLILLDLHLPDIDGDEVLARLQADPELARCPVVICTADATAAAAGDLLAVGAIDYLVKPIDFTRLYAIVEQTRGSATKSIAATAL